MLSILRSLPLPLCTLPSILRMTQFRQSERERLTKLLSNAFFPIVQLSILINVPLFYTTNESRQRLTETISTHN